MKNLMRRFRIFLLFIIVIKCAVILKATIRRINTVNKEPINLQNTFYNNLESQYVIMNEVFNIQA